MENSGNSSMNKFQKMFAYCIIFGIVCLFARFLISILLLQYTPKAINIAVVTKQYENHDGANLVNYYFTVKGKKHSGQVSLPHKYKYNIGDKIYVIYCIIEPYSHISVHSTNKIDKVPTIRFKDILRGYK